MNLILVIGFVILIYWVVISRNPKSTKKDYVAKSYDSTSGGRSQNNINDDDLHFREIPISRNNEVIKNAIVSGKDIVFSYRDRKGDITKRTISPQRTYLYTFGDDGKMPCVEGYCHLRNAMRTFAIFRMTDLRIK